MSSDLHGASLGLVAEPWRVTTHAVRLTTVFLCANYFLLGESAARLLVSYSTLVCWFFLVLGIVPLVYATSSATSAQKYCSPTAAVPAIRHRRDRSISIYK